MNKEKFIKILEHNQDIIANIEDIVENDRQDIMLSNVSSALIFTSIESEATLIMLPMTNKDIGAFVCRIDGRSYMVINTAQPRGKQYFYALHDLYHIKHKFSNNCRIEDYRCEANIWAPEYDEDPIEREASLYAAIMIIKSSALKKVYSNLIRINPFERVLIEIANHFCAPLSLVLLRLAECKLLGEDTEKIIEQYCELTDEKIETLFDKYGIDKSSIESNRTNNINSLINWIQKDEEIQMYNYPEDIESGLSDIMKILKNEMQGGQYDSV